MELKRLFVDLEGRIFDAIDHQEIKAKPIGEPIPFFSFRLELKSPELQKFLEDYGLDLKANGYFLSNVRNMYHRGEGVNIRAVQFYRVE